MTDLDVEPEFLAPGEDDDRLIPISNSHLSEGRCECGAVALVAPGQHPRCGACLRSDADMGSGVAPAPVAGLIPLGQGHPPRPPSGRAAYPAPEVTSRDEWDGAGAPAAFTATADKVRAAGWRVAVQRSRGCPPHGATGAPMAPRDLFALIAQSPDGRASAYAVRDAKVWTSIMVWSSTTPWFPSASVSDLLEFIAAGGDVPPGWFDAIRARIADQEARKEELKACNAGRHAMRFRSQTGDTMACSRCGNSWLAKGEPWKKPKSKKTEAN